MNRTTTHQFLALAAGIAGFFVISAPSLCWGQLWGIQPATNRIVRVNPANGMAFGGFVPPGGALSPLQQFGGLTMAEHGAVMLYQNPQTNPTDLFRLNPNTGTLLSTSFMPAAGTAAFRAGLSFQSGAGVAGADAIYAINDGAPVQRQDGYGDPTLVDHSPSGAQIAGALGGDDNGRQFVSTVTGIREFHPTIPNLDLNLLPLPIAAGQTVGGLAFDGTWIYLSTIVPSATVSTGRLYTINPNTGAVANDVLVQGGALIGLAARPVPEPATALLAVLAGLYATCFVVRRSR